MEREDVIGIKNREENATCKTFNFLCKRMHYLHHKNNGTT